MPDIKPASAVPATSTAGNESSSTVAAPVTNEPQYVTVDEYKALLNRLDGISANLNRLQKGASEKPEPKPEQKQVQPDHTLTARVAELEAQRKLSEARNLRVNKKLAKQAISKVAADFGLGGLADEFSDLMSTRLGDRVIVNEEDDGVYIQESDEKRTPVKDYVSAYFQTDKGKTWIPPKRNPSVEQIGDSASSVTAAVSKLSSMSFKEIMGLMDTNPGLVTAYINNFPDEYAKKRAEGK